MANETKEHEFTVRMNGSIEDYHVAPGGDGPLADEWADKPHRLLYDLLGEIQALRRERSAAVETLEKLVTTWREKAKGHRHAGRYGEGVADAREWDADDLDAFITSLKEQKRDA